MEIPSSIALESWLVTKNVKSISVRPLGGGSICRTERHILSDGASIVVKRGILPMDPEQFPAEAEGLKSLRVQGAPRVPEILLASEDILVLEDLLPGRQRGSFWERLGHSMATLHSVPGPAFGFFRDGFLGSTRLPNDWIDDGHAFFAGRRLLPLLRSCRDEGHLDLAEVRAGERLAGRLRDLLPAVRPMLVHGDFWNGNVLCDSEGHPCLIDPFTHYGWPEADIAMSYLFGGFHESFSLAWEESFRPENGWRSRIPIHNLVHLLNHLHLFGTSYKERTVEILERFGG